MSHNDEIERKIAEAKKTLAESKHLLAQLSGDPKDYEAAALLFDECEGTDAEQKARQCRKAARLLMEAE